MKIYTKLGDKGQTSLIGGKRVPKDNIRIEAYGTIDELIAYIAVIRDLLSSDYQKELLLKIQYTLMDCAAILASDDTSHEYKLPEIKDDIVSDLENKIDEIEKELPPLKNFIIPGGHLASSHCHVARNICRRAERIIIKLNNNAIINQNLLRYINRLSDFLFVMARKILIDSSIKEILWKK